MSAYPSLEKTTEMCSPTYRPRRHDGFLYVKTEEQSTYTRIPMESWEDQGGQGVFTPCVNGSSKLTLAILPSGMPLPRALDLY